jgi:hypothetical protein
VRRWVRSTALLAAACVCGEHALAGDGLGTLVFSSPPPGYGAFDAPFQRYRAVGISFNNQVLPAIRHDGRPVVFAAVGTSTVPFLNTPANLVTVKEIGAAIPWIVAIDHAGMAHGWGPSPPVWLPREPVHGLCVSTTFGSALTARGTIVAWRTSQALAVSGSSEARISAAVSNSGWGVSVGADGGTDDFLLEGVTSAPVLTHVRGASKVVVSGTAGVPLVLALMADGSLRSLAGQFDEPGKFKAISSSNSKVAAIRDDGQLIYWTRSGGELTSRTAVPGAYDAVGLSGSGGVLALWSSDTDRDGQDDAAQADAGELPDINGDMVDDGLQTPWAIPDQNANGIPDLEECRAVAGSHVAKEFFGPAGFGRVGWFALDTVPRRVGAVRRALLYTTGPGANQLPPEGLPARYSLWVDPDGDGSPHDAVLVRSVDIVLDPRGLTEIPLGNINLGPPGTRVFHGISFLESALGRAYVFPTNRLSVPATTTTDPFGPSRVRGRVRIGSIGSQFVSNDDTTLLALNSMPLEGYGSSFSRYLPAITLDWGDRTHTDCDGDGLLDDVVLAGGGVLVGGIDLDIDGNGVLDACERDCDGDTELDDVEISAGSADCDSDLVPDECEDGLIDVTIQGAVPSSASPVILKAAVSPAIGPVTVTVEAIADLGAPTEALLLRFGKGRSSVLFANDGSDCPAEPDRADFVMDAGEFNESLASGLLMLTFGATTLVDPDQCGDGFIRVRIQSSPIPVDCDGDGNDDRCMRPSDDCNGNGIPDDCDLPAADSDLNGMIDACEFDCDRDGVPDAIELAIDPQIDCDADGFIDACQVLDCDGNGLNDRCELARGLGDCNGNGQLDACEYLPDCNDDGIPEACQPSTDCNGNGSPDTCDLRNGAGDCDSDGILDACEIADGAADKDQDVVPDQCEYSAGDFDLDGQVGGADLGLLLSAWGTNLPIADLNGDGTIGGADLGLLLSRWGLVTFP